jgi:hypothetical protein
MINLAAALVGLVALEVWRRTRVWYLFRASRAFWQPLLKKPARVFVAEFLSSEIRTYELAGLTGLGELYAVVHMLSRFSEARLPRDLPITTFSQSSPTMLAENLIILGGPDVNQVSMKVENAEIYTIRSVRGENNQNMLVDSMTNTEYKSTVETVRVSGREVEVVRDYGLIVRARNPFNPKRSILMLVGAYGYGIVAAADVCLENAQTLETFLKGAEHGFECLVSYSMTGGPPGLSKIEFIRALSPPSLKSGSAPAER